MTMHSPRTLPSPLNFAAIVLRVALGLVFMWAAYDKILHPEAFAKIVYDYRILPDSLVNLAALFLPWFELCCGLALVCNRLSRGAAIACVVLLAVFLATLAFNHARGLDVACGCFSTQAKAASIWFELGRDAVLLIAAALVAIHACKRGARQ